MTGVFFYEKIEIRDTSRETVKPGMYKECRLCEGAFYASNWDIFDWGNMARSSE